MELTDESKAGLVDIIYYTDPLCCWSWAFEPQWRRLLYEYEGQLSYRYCMSGLLPSWNNYNDSVNNVTRPIQMGPVWMHAQQLSGMPIQHTVWMKDPPSSSYLACIAVKCAALQSSRAGEMYLRLLREALMIEGKNTAKRAVLTEKAEQLAALVPGFSVELFREDMKNDKGLEAFRKDLNEVQRHHISRFPSLVIRNRSGQAVLFSGYRPYSVLTDALRQIAPLEKTNPVRNPEKYKALWPLATEREMAEFE
jgi:putative protein-disulfide isomerase